MITLRVRYCYVQSFTSLVSAELPSHDHSFIATYMYRVVLHAHSVRGESHNQRNTTGEVAALPNQQIFHNYNYFFMIDKMFLRLDEIASGRIWPAGRTLATPDRIAVTDISVLALSLFSQKSVTPHFHAIPQTFSRNSTDVSCLFVFTHRPLQNTNKA